MTVVLLTFSADHTHQRTRSDCHEGSFVHFDACWLWEATQNLGWTSEKNRQLGALHFIDRGLQFSTEKNERSCKLRAGKTLIKNKEEYIANWYKESRTARCRGKVQYSWPANISTSWRSLKPLRHVQKPLFAPFYYHFLSSSTETPQGSPTERKEERRPRKKSLWNCSIKYSVRVHLESAICVHSVPSAKWGKKSERERERLRKGDERERKRQALDSGSVLHSSTTEF